MKIRQIVLAARKLEPVVEDLRAVLGLEVAHRDPNVAAFGLENAVLPVGTQFLEVVSPIRDGTAAGRFLDKRGGDGGYMIMLQTNDFAAARRRIGELGVRVVFSVELEDIVEIHLHPRDVPGAIVSISEARPEESWRWAGPDWQAFRRTDVVDAVAGVEFGVGDPIRFADLYAEALGLNSVESATNAGATLELASGEIAFVPRNDDTQDRVIAYDLRATNAERALAAAEGRGLPVRRDGGARAVRIAGTWLRLR